MNLKDPFLFRFSWIVLIDPRENVYAHDIAVVGESDFEFAPRTGTEFMNMICNRYLWRLEDHTVSGVQLFKKKRDPEDPTELMYTVVHRAENGQCIFDNTQTCTTIQINGKPGYTRLTIGLELAEKMKWIKMGTLDNGQPGYVLGPNFRKEFPKNVVSAAVDLVIPTTRGDEIFYKIDVDTKEVHLSSYINWVFMDLDQSYEQAFGSNRRTLHVYSNVGHSMVTGNQVTDLLKHMPPQHVSIRSYHTEVEENTFPLCRSCVKDEQSKPLTEKSYFCSHTLEEQCLVGTWRTPELEEALRQGYVIQYVYEVWHFPRKSNEFVHRVHRHVSQDKTGSERVA